MKPLTEMDLRSSLVNALGDEPDRMTLPGLHEVVWEEREFLGWRDVRSPRRGYIVAWTEHGPVGAVVSAADSWMSSAMPAMCSLCHTTQPAKQVSMFSAARSGEAGRNGNTLGTYICDDLACSIIIRKTPPPSDQRPEPWAMVDARAEALRGRVLGFLAGVMGAKR